jgi:hypothetical protein
MASTIGLDIAKWVFLLDHRYFQSAVGGMDERIRVRTFDRRAPQSADPSRSYPRNERRVLSPEALEGPTTAPARSGDGRHRRPRYRRNPRPPIITKPAMRIGPHEGPPRINHQPRVWPAFAPPLTPTEVQPMSILHLRIHTNSSLFRSPTPRPNLSGERPRFLDETL